MKILDTIESVSQLRSLSNQQLTQLCQELRTLIIDTTLKNGGHLSSNLGVVELTVALLCSFHVPEDKIIFDVGHQSYAYKILTGRYKQFSTLRKKDGIAGFPRTSESEYDAFDAGHASTSLSAGLGLARARDIRGQHHHVVSVVGDGALSGGMCYEALDDGGQIQTPFIVILNDNRMSIARSVGGVSQYLSRLRTGRHYRSFKKRVQKAVTAIPKIGPGMARGMERLKNRIKYFVLPNVIFEELGFTYIGPIDGHDIKKLCDLFDHAKTLKQPCFLHVITQKGKGYTPAEANPEKYHGVAPYQIETPTPEKRTSNSALVGQTLECLAEQTPYLAAITAAMPSGTGLETFGKRFPDRFFDVGIAEEHAVAMAAGMAAQGLVPVVAMYSTFLQRAYDQLVHDVAIEGLHVIFCVDRAGIVGADGATHNGVLDVAFLRSIPGIKIFCPSNFAELRSMMSHALYHESGPVAIRYPRGGEGAFRKDTAGETIACVREAAGHTVTLLTHGVMINEAIAAADILESKGVHAQIYKVNEIGNGLADAFREREQELSGWCVVVEDVVESGSLGEWVAAHQGGRVDRLNTGDRFLPHGGVNELYRHCGIDAEGIASFVIKNRKGKENDLG